VGVPAVVDRLGAMSPEFLLVGSTGLVVVPAVRLPAGAVPAGVVCACAVKPSILAPTRAAKSVLFIIIN
jgi:hypothetical protein